MRRFIRFRAVAALACSAALAACAERVPTAPSVDPVPQTPAERTVRLECTASVTARTLSCAPAAPSGGALAALLVGSPYVALASSGASYDGSLVFRADVTVRNQMWQPIGTTDGSTEAPEGIRVFFHDGPNVTAGTGTVSVANEDGTGDFTASGQEFFRYDTLLAPGETSAPKEWRFDVPNTVEGFAFTLFVSVPVPNELGAVVVSPSSTHVAPGNTFPLDAVVRTGAGGVLQDPVTWSTSDPAVATVDANGVVTGVGIGTATITATAGQRSGASTIQVFPFDAFAPTLRTLTVAPQTVDVSSDGTVQLTATAADGGVGVFQVEFSLTSPGGATTESCPAARVAGTAANGTWQCSIALDALSVDGAWDVSVTLTDFNFNAATVDAAALAARGLPAVVNVTGGTADVTAPSVTAMDFTPDTVNVDSAAADVTFTFGVDDGQSGVVAVTVIVRSPNGRQSRSCGAFLASGDEASGTWTCTLQIPEDAEEGSWIVTSVQAQDGAGNVAELTTGDLQTAGFPAELVVISPNADITPPSLTAFSISPDTVSNGSGDASVTFTATVEDSGVGVSTGTVTVRSPSGAQVRSCTLAFAGGSAASGTWTCSATVQQGVEGGTWSVIGVTVQDALGNAVTYDNDALLAAGFERSFLVTN